MITPNELLESIDAMRLWGGQDGTFPNLESIADAAERIATFEKFDAQNIHIHVWHSGLGKKSWMFEIRRNGMLRGSFENVSTSFETREEADRAAFEVAESMLDGTFELRFTS